MQLYGLGDMVIGEPRYVGLKKGSKNAMLDEVVAAIRKHALKFGGKFKIQQVKNSRDQYAAKIVRLKGGEPC